MSGPNLVPCSVDHRPLAADTTYLVCPHCGYDLSLLRPEKDNPDYITLLACINPHKAIVAVMSFNKAEDSYTMKKCSDALSTRSAGQLADSWAAALRLEIR